MPSACLHHGSTGSRSGRNRNFQSWGPVLLPGVPRNNSLGPHPHANIIVSPTLRYRYIIMSYHSLSDMWICSMVRSLPHHHIFPDRKEAMEYGHAVHNELKERQRNASVKVRISPILAGFSEICDRRMFHCSWIIDLPVFQPSRRGRANSSFYRHRACPQPKTRPKSTSCDLRPRTSTCARATATGSRCWSSRKSSGNSFQMFQISRWQMAL